MAKLRQIWSHWTRETTETDYDDDDDLFKCGCSNTIPTFASID